VPGPEFNVDSPTRIVTQKLLSVCPADKAVDWLNERRKQRRRWFLAQDGETDSYELILLNRFDCYIDFGLAKYGTSFDIAKQLYARADEALRRVILANTPAGGFNYNSENVIAEPSVDRLSELHALMSNPHLPDGIFRRCFARDGIFGKLTENEFRELIIHVTNNTRLSTPYYEAGWMDGWAQHDYHKVFDDAWNLANSMPTTEPWAYALWMLLRRTEQPLGFKPKPAINRWQIDPPIEPNERYPYRPYSFALRSRLADLVKADESLLQADDLALRLSLYRRFNPARFPNWSQFYDRDGEDFLDAARSNEALWQLGAHRDRLSELHWQHSRADPNHDLLLPNQFKSIEREMKANHPDWFVRECTAETPEITTMFQQLEDKVTTVVAQVTALKWLLYGAIAAFAILSAIK
jgi:hypothetical protein